MAALVYIPLFGSCQAADPEDRGLVKQGAPAVPASDRQDLHGRKIQTLFPGHKPQPANRPESLSQVQGSAGQLPRIDYATLPPKGQPQQITSRKGPIYPGDWL
jgi:hypothetical protein